MNNIFRTNDDTSSDSAEDGEGWVMDSKTFEQLIEEEVNLYRAKHKIKLDE